MKIENGVIALELGVQTAKEIAQIRLAVLRQGSRDAGEFQEAPALPPVIFLDVDRRSDASADVSSSMVSSSRFRAPSRAAIEAGAARTPSTGRRFAPAGRYSPRLSSGKAGGRR